ncbi:MAG: nucleotide exchange factor GrpE [Rhodocyclaceae bacterium]|nr:nucleotide exchange factor GrpE [Rhodocyclaceae bacterium]
MSEREDTVQSLPEAEATSSTAETASNAGEAASDKETLPSLEEQLRIAELKAAEHYDAWLRAKAETENVRRRAQEDLAKAAKFAIERFAAELLAVKDSLEAALADQNQSPEALRAGVELTLKQLVAAFEKHAVAEINPLGKKFDPHLHQAIALVESEAAPNTVVSVLQKGYRLHERILRPALVTVAKAKENAENA